MVDVLGQPVNVGDEVVYAGPISTNSGFGNSTGKSGLVTGTVLGLRANETEAIVQFYSRKLYLKSKNLIRVNWSEIKKQYSKGE